MKERTIRSVLEEFQKVELEDLGDLLGGNLRPRMKKTEMVERLTSYLTKSPQRWLSHLLERDARLLRQLVHAGPDTVQMMDFADYPSVLEVSGLVDYDDSDQRTHKVWLRREVYDIVAPHIDKAIHVAEQSGRFQVERVALGYLNLYGIIPTDRFVDLLMDYYDAEHESDYETLTGILKDSQLVKGNRFTDERGDYLCSPCLMEAEDIFKLRDTYARDLDYAAFSWQEAMEAGAGAPYFTIGLKTPAGRTFVSMLHRLGFEGFELVQTEYDFWMEAQLPQTAESVFRVVDMDEYHRYESHTYDLYMKAVRDYANNLPRWALKGHSAAETGLLGYEIPDEEPPEIPYEEGQPVWSMPEPTVSEGYTQFLDEFPFMVPHVAPDDPCPCGSGLRYSRCHGKHPN